MTTRVPAANTLGLVALMVVSLIVPTVITAADHSEAPGTVADQPADIADVYVWHDAAANKLTAVITFAGLQAPRRGFRGTFDEDVLYTLNIDNNGDFNSDVDVQIGFSQDAKDKWRMTIENLPGSPGTIVAPVNRSFKTGNGNRVFGGLRDDPFFFDLEGFITTVQTGTLSFDGNRDSVAGLNATAIVMEMDLSAALGGGSILNLWATSARK